MKLNKHKIAISLLVFAVIWIVLAPWLLTRQEYSFLDFKLTGPIGDTIGGITAPIIGLVSAILVYLSFSAQIEANKITQNESNFRYILDEFERTKVKIKKHRYYFSNKPVEMGPEKGPDALHTFGKNLVGHFTLEASKWIYDAPLEDAYYLLRNYSIFISECRRLNLSDDQRQIVEAKIYLYHSENLRNAFDNIALWAIKRPEEGQPVYFSRAFEVKVLAATIDYQINTFTIAFS
jgi:hypothetical protein